MKVIMRLLVAVLSFSFITDQLTQKLHRLRWN